MYRGEPPFGVGRKSWVRSFPCASFKVLRPKSKFARVSRACETRFAWFPPLSLPSLARSLAPSPLHSGVATPATRNRKIRPKRVNIRKRGSILTVHHLWRSDRDRSLEFCLQFLAAWPLFPSILSQNFQIFKRTIFCYECNSEPGFRNSSWDDWIWEIECSWLIVLYCPVFFKLPIWPRIKVEHKNFCIKNTSNDSKRSND